MIIFLEELRLLDCCHCICIGISTVYYLIFNKVHFRFKICNITTHHLRLAENYALTDWKTNCWRFLEEYDSIKTRYLHILHLPGVSTKEVCSFHCCIQMQSKVNVIINAYFFFFSEHFVLVLICSLSWISIEAFFVFLYINEKKENCAGFNCVCEDMF